MMLETTWDANRIPPVMDKCLKGTYFLYNGEYYLLIYGAAIMGSPPIVCEIYMEDFKQRPGLKTFTQQRLRTIQPTPYLE